MKIILGLKFIYTHVVVEAVPSSISSAWYTFLTDVKGRAANPPPSLSPTTLFSTARGCWGGGS